jgi:hypothetical protein
MVAVMGVMASPSPPHNGMAKAHALYMALNRHGRQQVLSVFAGTVAERLYIVVWCGTHQTTLMTDRHQ